MPFRFPWQKATDTDNSAEKQSLTKPSPTSNSASLDPSEAVINPSSSTMVADLKSKLNQFEANVMKDGDAATSAKMLTELKIGLTTLPSLMPGATITKSSIQELEVARDVYEVASLFSVKQEDEESFERHISQVKTFYVDYGSILPDSKRQNLILGLSLMRLMAQNRIAEFHTELELVPQRLRSNDYIAYALRLESYLMEGSYSKIREEKISVPDPTFNFFVDNLMVTVREEIAACATTAYQTLPVSSAQRMLSISTGQEMKEFCQEKSWKEVDGVIHFLDDTDKGPSMEQVQSSELIHRSLEYARELEQIV